MQSFRHPRVARSSPKRLTGPAIRGENHMTLPNYFDVKEAARRFGLSESWLAKLRVKGGGPSHIKCGRRVLYEVKSFEDWLEARRRSSTSKGGR
jgi:hypothetical protein